MTPPHQPWAHWAPAEPARAGRAFRRIAFAHRVTAETLRFVSARATTLPFYRQHLLVELTVATGDAERRIYALDDGRSTLLLDGTAEAIHTANEVEGQRLDDDTVEPYLRFFLFCIRSDEGAFTLVEDPTDVTLAEGGEPAAPDASPDVSPDASPDETSEAPPSDDPPATRDERLVVARAAAVPLARVPLPEPADDEPDPGPRWMLRGTVAYGDDLYRCDFEVREGGATLMTADDVIVGLQGLVIERYPPIDIARVERPAPRSGRPAGDTDGDVAPRALAEGGATARDREVTEALVHVLLDEALRQRERDLLLRHFNSESGADRPLDVLARAVVSSSPVVVIESDIPFVEEFVAGLLVGTTHGLDDALISRASVQGGDESQATLKPGRRDRLLLVSFHAYRSLFDLERTVHELTLNDATVLVGCPRASDLPEPLRRISDLVLRLPRLDRRLFARVFERIFGALPPAGWDAPGTDWTQYLLPADFHAPRRLGLEGERAVGFLRSRVEARLRTVTVEGAPSLEELHGLGEARQVCEDLIADIRAAQLGQIPWTAVDRGLLLVGPPGTGKTTLARAVAKSCGIKFISASAASWQSAGYLDAHLRAIRAQFAEARRYAPAILFIDEIDSIGNRERFEGNSAVYQTEVVNALLEQMQGLDPAEPVIVLAATNHVDKVDPALRRAGRLDQVVHIPLPSIPGLARIFEFYLQPLRVDQRLADDVDAQALAALAFGLTGADVEFFVRGAGRRARKEGRAVTQADLVAEVTRRPRQVDGAPRLGRDALRRVAVHEGGHVVARLLGSTAGDDITFVSVIPRLDGTLGFVATVPAGGEMPTRRQLLERLETILAGRAAEEIVYGAAEFSTGAGGRDRSSDLAVATELATLIVCQTGIGDDGSLLWTAEPTDAQLQQVDALLRRAYAAIRARLESHRTLLDRVTEALVREQELTGAQLRALLAAITS